jgi:polar amino acid transport system substrate-binding protein
MRLMNYSLLFMGFLGSLSYSHASLELIESGKLHVATSGKYPPYSFLNEAGKLDGLEIKLMEEVCRRLGLEYIPMLVAWESLIPGLLTGKYDISTLAMDITPEREKQATFIQPWIESKGVLVVRDDTFIKNLKTSCLCLSVFYWLLHGKNN